MCMANGEANDWQKTSSVCKSVKDGILSGFISNLFSFSVGVLIPSLLTASGRALKPDAVAY